MESELGALLREYRAAAGLTQEALAVHSGVSAQAISALERGYRRFPHRATVDLLATALGLADDERALLVDSAARGQGRTRVRRARVVPRQLPFATADFSGREEQVATLTALLSPGPAGATTVAIAAISGMGGVGKTALAVQVGHLVAEHYPDGQLYLDLRGYGADPPLPPGEALRALLAAAGAETGGPADTDPASLSARLRSALAGRRVLMVLDNATDAAHVAQLLPGTAGSAAVVTSRRRLTSLAGAVQVHLGTLPESDAVDMLAGVAGIRRVLHQREAAARVVRLCGQLPLAIRIAGARLAARPAWPVAHLADRLVDERRRLDELTVDDLGVRASVSVSVGNLVETGLLVDAQAAEAFTRLGLPNWPEISLAVAARLMDLPEPAAEQVLERLVDVNLLGAGGPGNYRQHDLLRAFARDRVAQEFGPADRAGCLLRVLDLYVGVAWRSKQLIRPGSTAMNWADEAWLAAAPDLSEVVQALGWLDAERANLLPAAEQAAGDPAVDSGYVVRLALGLHEYYLSRHDWSTALSLTELALRVLAGAPDLIAESLLRTLRGAAYAELGRYDEAVLELQQCVTLSRATAQPRGEALGYVNLGRALAMADRLTEALAAAECGLRNSLEIGDEFAEAHARLMLGRVYRLLGRYAEQQEMYERALVLFEQQGDRLGMANTLCEVGIGQHEAKKQKYALRVLHDAFETYFQIGRIGDQVSVLEHLAETQLDLGRGDEAVDCLHEALGIAASHDRWRLEARVRLRLGHVLNDAGQTLEAREQWEAALQLHAEQGTDDAEQVRRLLDTLAARDTPAGRLRGA